MPDPYDVATSAQFRPDLGYAYASDPSWNPPHTQINSARESMFYTVQPGDTLGAVARALFGSNVPQTRAKLQQAGFYPGSVIEY